ncbi:MAG: helix-turn-helix transcriptional regulator [Candidatus Aminicenantes bacterium]|nr:helix-turn-helix transcriptional regulator [Candidatus Aminicenantes bacterium]
MIHLKILVYICASMLGIGAAVYAYLIQRAFPRPFLRPLFFFLVFHNLLNFLNLTSMYGCANLLGFCSGYGYTVFPAVLGPLARLSQYGILVSLAGIVHGFHGRRLSRAVWKGFTAGATVLTAGYAVFGFMVAQGRFLPWLFRGLRLTFDVSVAVSIILLAWILLLSFRARAAAQSRAMRALAVPYLAAYLVLIATFRLPTDTQFFPNALMLLVILGFPILWIKRWFLPAYAAAEGDGDLESQAVERLCREGRLTAREGEIVRMILRGGSNSEIGTALFISAHTVKNHLTSILLKLGLKNRMQMIARVQALQKELQTDFRIASPPPSSPPAVSR